METETGRTGSALFKSEEDKYRIYKAAKSGNCKKQDAEKEHSETSEEL